MGAQTLAQHLADFNQKLSLGLRGKDLPVQISAAGCSLERNAAKKRFGF
jgi:hypothetical protein